MLSDSIVLTDGGTTVVLAAPLAVTDVPDDGAGAGADPDTVADTIAVAAL